jgi:hypothetical protein
MYQMQRVFCATSWELEAERRAFYDVVGEVNETGAMTRGVLYVPVTLTNIRDKRPLQYTVEENIRECSYYLLAMTEGWGPPERNFARDYRLAVACRDDASRPMRDVAMLWEKAADGSAVPDGLPQPAAEFSTTDEFRRRVGALLTAWLSSSPPRS